VVYITVNDDMNRGKLIASDRGSNLFIYSLLSKFKFVHIYPIYHILHYELGHHGAVERSGVTI
jgi:hypothetical protein